MAKLFLSIALAVFFISCKQNPDCQTQGPQSTGSTSTASSCPNPVPDPGPTPEPVPTPVPEPTPEPMPSPVPSPDPDKDSEVPHEALIFDANIKLYNFGPEDEAKVEKAIEIIKKVVASKEFRDRVINYTYQGEKAFVDNGGMTNEEVYQTLLDGKELLVPEVDNEMDLELQLYYSWRSTVGYTTPGEMRIYMNTKFFYPYTPAEVAGNVFHEWTHKLGFNHDSSYSVSRDSSVPYAIGYLIEELGKQFE